MGGCSALQSPAAGEITSHHLPLLPPFRVREHGGKLRLSGDPRLRDSGVSLQPAPGPVLAEAERATGACKPLLSRGVDTSRRAVAVVGGLPNSPIRPMDVGILSGIQI